MTLEEEIKKLKEGIKAWKPNSFLENDPEIIELREMIMHVHEIGEGFASSLISKRIKSTMGIEMNDFSSSDKIDVALYDITKEMDFARLINVLENYQMEPKLRSRLHEVNQLRLEFSHLIAKYEEIKKYSEKENYKKALKTLYDSLEELKKSAKVNFPDTFKPSETTKQ